MQLEKLMEIISISLWAILLVGLPIIGVFLFAKKYQVFPKRVSGKILIIEAGGRATAIIPEIKGWFFDSTKGVAGLMEKGTSTTSRGLWPLWLSVLNSLFGRYGPVIPPFRNAAGLKILLPKWRSEGDKKVVEKSVTDPTSTAPFFLEIPFISQDVETKSGLPAVIRATLLANVLDPITFLYLASDRWYATIQSLIQELINVVIPKIEFDRVATNWERTMVKGLALRADNILARVGLGNLELRFEGIDPSGTQAEQVRKATIANRLAELEGEAKVTKAKKENEAATQDAEAFEKRGAAKVKVANDLADATKDSPYRTAAIVANQQQIAAVETKATVFAPGGGSTPTAITLPPSKAAEGEGS